MWPFSKNKNAEEEAPVPSPEQEAVLEDAVLDEEVVEDEPAFEVTQTEYVQPTAAGPFDAVDSPPEEHDFSDFAKATVNLGSILLPIPKIGDIQVEMGPKGPTMLHLVTKLGRITPVAFAAPTSGGQWDASVSEIATGLSNDGLKVSIVEGPWGREIHGTRDGVAMAVIGVDGPRWMLRMTMSGPEGSMDELLTVGREVIARTFVNRDDSPVPAGQTLPVTLPAQMAQQIREAYEQRQKQAAAQQQGNQQNNEGGQ